MVRIDPGNNGIRSLILKKWMKMEIGLRLIVVILLVVAFIACAAMAVSDLMEEDLYLARTEELKALDSLLDQAQKEIESLVKEKFLLKERIAELEKQLKEQRE